MTDWFEYHHKTKKNKAIILYISSSTQNSFNNHTRKCSDKEKRVKSGNKKILPNRQKPRKLLRKRGEIRDPKKVDCKQNLSLAFEVTKKIYISNTKTEEDPDRDINKRDKIGAFFFFGCELWLIVS